MKRSWIRVTWVLVGGVWTFATSAALGAQPDTAATKVVLLTADRALARASDARGEAFLERFEPTGVLLFPGQPVARANTVRQRYRERYQAGGRARFAWTPLAAIASADGTFGCTTGVTEITLAADTGSGPRHGRYVSCWRRDASGAWRIMVHARNGETAGSPAPTLDSALAPHSATEQGGDELGAVLAADVAFARVALDSGPAPAFVRWAAADAMLLGPRPVPAQGEDAVRASFDGFPAPERLMWLPVRSIGFARGGLGFTVGESVTAVPDSVPVSRGKYLTVWRQGADGSWRFVYDLGSPRPAIAADMTIATRIRRQAAEDALRRGRE